MLGGVSFLGCPLPTSFALYFVPPRHPDDEWPSPSCQTLCPRRWTKITRTPEKKRKRKANTWGDTGVVLYIPHKGWKSLNSKSTCVRVKKRSTRKKYWHRLDISRQEKISLSLFYHIRVLCSSLKAHSSQKENEYEDQRWNESFQLLRNLLLINGLQLLQQIHWLKHTFKPALRHKALHKPTAYHLSATHSGLFDIGREKMSW